MAKWTRATSKLATSAVLLGVIGLIAPGQTDAAADGYPVKWAELVIRRNPSDDGLVGERGSTEGVSDLRPLISQARLSDKSTMRLRLELLAPAHQVLLTVSDLRDGGSGPTEVYVATRAGLEYTIDTNALGKSEYWSNGSKYSMTLIVGDLKLKSTVVWTLCDYLDYSVPKPRNEVVSVFNFDTSSKRTLQDEFRYTPPAPDKRAPPAFSLAWTGAALAPLAGVIVVWGKLGALPVRLPEGAALGSFVAFELCLVLAAVILVQFWLGWTILKAWYYLGLLAVPTVMSGRRALAQLPKKLTS